MADILGHAGCVKEAEDLLHTIPNKDNIVGWMSFLSDCTTYSNVDGGKRCFKRVTEVDSRHASGYALMSNIYASAGMLEDADKVLELRKCANAWKKPGEAFIEIDNKIHGFIVEDKTHPQTDEIYSKIGRLYVQMEN